MDKKEKIFDSLWMKALLIISILALGFSVRTFLLKQYQKMQTINRLQSFDTDNDYNEGGLGRDMSSSEHVTMEHPLMQAFELHMPGQDIIFGCEEDLTNDGKKDLLVLYRIAEGVRLVAVLNADAAEDYHYSEPIPAPVENQKIRFFNMDKEGEMEFIIQGSKHGVSGYGIFRIIDGEPVNLFAEGMEDC